MGISIIIACSLVLRPVVEKLLGPPPPSYFSSDLSKGTFTRMDDGELRLRGVQGGQSESTATAYANGDRDRDFHQGTVARGSGIMEERTSQDLSGYPEESGIKVHTEWKVSTKANVPP